MVPAFWDIRPQTWLCVNAAGSTGKKLKDWFKNVSTSGEGGPSPCNCDAEHKQRAGLEGCSTRAAVDWTSMPRAWPVFQALSLYPSGQAAPTSALRADEHHCPEEKAILFWLLIFQWQNLKTVYLFCRQDKLIRNQNFFFLNRQAALIQPKILLLAEFS